MKPVIKKTDLLKILRENRTKHRKVFEDAAEGYFSAFQAELDRQRKRVLRAEKPQDIRIILNAPEDRTYDYDRIVGMVELDTRDVIELTESEFACYVQDDWSWKRAWLKTSNEYATGSTQKAYGTDWMEVPE